MNTVLTLCSALAGFAALSLAMDRHYEDYRGRGTSPGSNRRWLRVGGTLALGASLWAAVAVDGPSQGWVFWFGALTVAALTVVLTLSYAPRSTARLLQAGSLLALLSAAGSLALR